MRQIKFRGKRIDDGEWIYGYLDDVQEQYGYATINYVFDDGEEYWESCDHVDVNTVGQYTGLKDCNDNKIFEGDIFDIGGLLKGVITWHNDGYWCIAEKEISHNVGMFKASYRHLGEMIDIAKERKYPYKVVGNIYE